MTITSQHNASYQVVTLLSALSLVPACGRSQPKNLAPPEFQPSTVAQQAIEQYDTNGDGRVGGDEFAACPGLKAALKSTDFNDDGHPDLLLAGNYWDREVETRRSDASVGLLMLNDGRGSFNTVHPTQSGFNAWMDARAVELIRTANGEAVVVANNNGPAQLFAIGRSPQAIGD